MEEYDMACDSQFDSWMACLQEGLPNYMHCDDVPETQDEIKKPVFASVSTVKPKNMLAQDVTMPLRAVYPDNWSGRICVFSALFRQKDATSGGFVTAEIRRAYAAPLTEEEGMKWDNDRILEDMLRATRDMEPMGTPVFYGFATKKKGIDYPQFPHPRPEKRD